MTAPDRPVPRVVPNDYDADPGRFAANLSFRAGAFGTVAALWMLYHLADPATALREAHRVLRPAAGWSPVFPAGSTIPNWPRYCPAGDSR